MTSAAGPEYPMRRYGMDHDRYAWSMLSSRPKVEWPNGKKLALWVSVGLQFFPMNPMGQPIKVAGGMTMPYPDLRHFSLRDYGNRVGIFRVLQALERYKIKPTFAMNTRLAERYPALLARIINAIHQHGGELMCHSWSMDSVHAGGLALDDERRIVAAALRTLRALSGQPVRGWISPGKIESANTPDLLAEHGIDYFCDWVNDDMPYRFNTTTKPLWAMPLATELEDRFLLLDNFHSEQSYAQQVLDAAAMLINEAQTAGGRVLGLSIHPWVLGQPHRIKYLEQVLEQLAGHVDVWSTTPGEILRAMG